MPKPPAEGPQHITAALGNLRGLVLETKGAHCEAHGGYIDRHIRGFAGNTSRWAGCPECARIAGDVALREQHAKDLAEAAAARARALADRFATTGVPRRFLQATWDNYRTTDTAGDERTLGSQAFAKARCMAYAQNFATKHLPVGRTLILSGNHGTGKNHLATCIARQIAEAGHSVVFTTAEQMLMAWQDVVVHRVPGNRGLLSLLRDFASPQLLVLDEMFRQSDTPAARRFLFEVLNARYADALPTLIISNKTPEEIKKLMDPVLVSRLEERGAIVVPFPWEDQRPKVGKCGM